MGQPLGGGPFPDPAGTAFPMNFSVLLTEPPKNAAGHSLKPTLVVRPLPAETLAAKKGQPQGKQLGQGKLSFDHSSHSPVIGRDHRHDQQGAQRSLVPKAVRPANGLVRQKINSQSPDRPAAHVPDSPETNHQE